MQKKIIILILYFFLFINFSSNAKTFYIGDEVNNLFHYIFIFAGAHSKAGCVRGQACCRDGIKKTSKSIMTSWRPLFYKATTEVFALTELLGKQLPNVDTWVNLDSLKDRSF